MKVLTRSGRFYSLHGSIISILGMKGHHNGILWQIQDSNKRIRNIPAHYVSEEITQKVEQIDEAGYGDSINRIVISQRYAIYLFLEGYITSSRFRGAVEGFTNSEPHFITFERGCFPCVLLNPVVFGRHEVPILVLREKDLSFDTVLVIDEHGTVM